MGDNEDATVTNVVGSTGLGTVSMATVSNRTFAGSQHHLRIVQGFDVDELFVHPYEPEAESDTSAVDTAVKAVSTSVSLQVVS